LNFRIAIRAMLIRQVRSMGHRGHSVSHMPSPERRLPKLLKKQVAEVRALQRSSAALQTEMPITT
jgi:hypothetical protein